MFLKLLMGLIGCFCQFAWAAVSLELEKTDISAGETVKVILTVEGDQANAIPDLSPLEPNFRIVGTQRAMNYTFINGSTRTITQWTVVLLPKKNGKLTLPALRVGEERTHPQDLNVTGSKQSTNNEAHARDGMMLLATVDGTAPYVNQQLIYTVKLYYTQRLLNIDYQPPKIEDALLMPLGQGRRHQEIKEGYMYAVEEQQYAIFPQKKGALKIQGPSLRALVEDQSGLPRNVVLQAKSTELLVKEIPSNTPPETWFPAKEVSLTEHYDEKKIELKTGDVLTRTISLEAVGVPGQLLPKINVVGNTDVAVYPEQTKETSHFRQGNIVGTNTLKVTYLFNREGRVTLPEIQIKWFNTETGKETKTVLPARQIQVLAAPLNQLVAEKGKGSLPLSASKDTSKEVIKASERMSRGKYFSAFKHDAIWRSPYLPWALVALLMLLWALTIGIFLFKKRKKQKMKIVPHISNKEAANPLWATRQVVLKNLKEACQNNSPEQAKDNLLAWARFEWPSKSCLNIGNLAEQTEDHALKQAIDHLSAMLYRGQSTQNWSGDALWTCVERILAQKKTKTNRRVTKKILPELHDL